MALSGYSRAQTFESTRRRSPRPDQLTLDHQYVKSSDHGQDQDLEEATLLQRQDNGPQLKTKQAPRWGRSFALAAIVLALLAGAVLLGRQWGLLDRPPMPFAVDSTGNAILWDDAAYLFAFGDSFTHQGHGMPWHNESPFPLPKDVRQPGDLGQTSSKGLNWVQWLSWRFNSTETKLYSFAQWGATIDNRIEQRGGIPSLFDEVNHFEAHFTTLPWSGSNSVFVSWFGTNDNDLLFGREHANHSLIPAMMDSYEASLSRLYDLGARQLVVLNVPPLFRSPAYRQDPASVLTVRPLVSDFNRKLVEVARHLRDSKTGLRIYIYDVHAATSLLLDTAVGIGVTSLDFCTFNVPAPIARDATDASCALPFGQYYWADSFHPSWVVHERLAQDIRVVTAAADGSTIMLRPGALVTGFLPPRPASASTEV